MIVHWVENYTQYLHYNVKKYWVFHNTLSGYIDRNIWMKAMLPFKTVCGANNINPQVLYYDGHVSYFKNRAINIILSHHIKPFIIKAGESRNDQTNDNVTNLKMKGLYGQARMNWQRQPGISMFTTKQMNYVLVKTLRYFQLSSAPVTINAFKKKSLYLSPHLTKTPTT